MAKNFRVCAKEGRNQSLALHLYGDFDGSSACELVHVLNASVKKANRVAIDTNGLRTVDTFGLEVFLPRMSGLKGNRADIEITGQFSEVFQE